MSAFFIENLLSKDLMIYVVFKRPFSFPVFTLNNAIGMPEPENLHFLSEKAIYGWILNR
ncbi:MAG: hypothetical protein GF350_09525 [Chitinivibrionales bacterium]|nr:hypothetical protein [Chitinivibrionales bacterium]